MTNKQKLYGRFYLQKTNNGNLIGEFSNNIENNIFTESADLISGNEASSCNYIGKYNATWQESGKSVFADLEISQKDNTNKIFVLKWSQNGQPMFKGEGMLCSNVLIGDYQEDK